MKNQYRNTVVDTTVIYIYMIFHDDSTIILVLPSVNLTRIAIFTLNINTK